MLRRKWFCEQKKKTIRQSLISNLKVDQTRINTRENEYFSCHGLLFRFLFFYFGSSVPFWFQPWLLLLQPAIVSLFGFIVYSICVVVVVVSQCNIFNRIVFGSCVMHEILKLCVTRTCLVQTNKTEIVWPVNFKITYEKLPSTEKSEKKEVNRKAERKME